MNFFTILLLFYILSFWPQACGILAPQTGIELAPHSLKDKVLITGPPGKSPYKIKQAQRKHSFQWCTSSSLNPQVWNATIELPDNLKPCCFPTIQAKHMGALSGARHAPIKPLHAQVSNSTVISGNHPYSLCTGGPNRIQASVVNTFSFIGLNAGIHYLFN